MRKKYEKFDLNTEKLPLGGASRTTTTTTKRILVKSDGWWAQFTFHGLCSKRFCFVNFVRPNYYHVDAIKETVRICGLLGRN